MYTGKILALVLFSPLFTLIVIWRIEKKGEFSTVLNKKRNVRLNEFASTKRQKLQWAKLILYTV